jgi:hypothetical protein
MDKEEEEEKIEEGGRKGKINPSKLNSWIRHCYQLRYMHDIALAYTHTHKHT